MGFDGFGWPHSNAIFEASAERSTGTRYDYSALVDKARVDGVRAHDLLRSYGGTGIEGPVRLENGELVGTARLHEDLTLRTSNGRSNFVHVDLEAVADRNELLGPNRDELRALTGRVNGLWESTDDDMRKPHLIGRWPWNHVEIHPEDAERLSIASGEASPRVGGNIAAALGVARSVDRTRPASFAKEQAVTNTTTDRTHHAEDVGELRQRLREHGWRSDLGWSDVGSGSAQTATDGAQGEARRTIAYLATLRAVDGGAGRVWKEGDVPAPPQADAREVLIATPGAPDWYSEVLEAPAETVEHEEPDEQQRLVDADAAGPTS